MIHKLSFHGFSSKAFKAFAMMTESRSRNLEFMIEFQCELVILYKFKRTQLDSTNVTPLLDSVLADLLLCLEGYFLVLP